MFEKRLLVGVLGFAGVVLGGCGEPSCENNGYAVVTPATVPTVTCYGGVTCNVTQPASGKYVIDCDPAVVMGATCWVGGEHCYRSNDLPTIDSFTWTRAKPTSAPGVRPNTRFGTSCCLDVSLIF